MTTQPVPDPRPLFAQAVDQAEQQIAAVRPTELGLSTPCDDYDLRALLGHMLAVLRKLARAGAGEDAREVGDVIEGIADTDWLKAFTETRAEVEAIWADDTLLDRMVTLPWGTMPGRAVVDAYTHEFTVHSWDVAHATGRLNDLDPSLAIQALNAFTEYAPPESRSEEGKFGPVIEVPDDADPYTRLAAYMGRRP
ncbi:TIGR03086 family metal-binding protein [Streptomyces boninensis]|uniref:TIGR03086 family metal-binding protein n=1 Tax=Streptomyces boninensis TaxID=2039455 RepID=UPI003B211991